MRTILVVGQGIAGCSLAWALQEQGAEVWMAADPDHAPASNVAAGVVNPVTGKRYVLSWRFAEFYTSALATYKKMEQAWETTLWHPREIVRLLESPEAANNWSLRAAQSEYAPYMQDATDAGPWQQFLREKSYYGKIGKAAQVDFNLIRCKLQATLEAAGRFLALKVGPEATPALLKEFDAIVFSEGALGSNNPYFPELPWKPAKGQGLLIEFKDPALAALLNNTSMPMLKKELMLASPGSFWQNLVWAGANYEWEFEDAKATPDGRDWVLDKLQSMLACDFEVKGQFAGIRPVVKDRRPVLGQSRLHPKMHIFNCFGSKGALLTPYFAAHFAAHLLEGVALEKDVDLRRFG